MSEARFTVLWNPNARSAEQAEEVRELLASRADVELRITSSASEARVMAQEIQPDRDGRVVAAGGDGTINAVINGIYENPQRPVLALLPLGTGNDLCRTLDIPLDPRHAVDLMLDDHRSPQAIDLVQARSSEGVRMFANVASGGNSQRIAECLDDEAKRRWGPWSYLRGALEVVRDLEGFDTRIRFDDQRDEETRLWNIIVANGKMAAGGLAVAPQAQMSDGLLDVVLVRDGVPLDVATLSMEFFLGDYLEDERVDFCHAQRLHVEASPPMSFAADGELIGTTPVTFEIQRQAIQVVAGTKARE